MTLPENLKKIRRQNKYSQEKLAELLGVSRQAVSKWETGATTPDTSNLIKLSKIYGVAIENLIGEQPEQKSMLNIEDPIKKGLSKLACIAYIASFASIIDYFCPPITNYPYPYTMFIILALISGVLLELKNKAINDKIKTKRVRTQDIIVIILACLTGKLIPNYIGLIKIIILVIPCAIYAQKTLYKYFQIIKN